jgi:hypothetical protein
MTICKKKKKYIFVSIFFFFEKCVYFFKGQIFVSGPSLYFLFKGKKYILKRET